ncbi:hypothetical protein [Bradyrhizobium sp. CCBAU 53380]|uniref:hypothetical protein n=1 Tax=Bradyrhizobium sp. CCBAU 53380 TaxID=1325117 RepID=UPI002302B696|nr:hypothetical protein [Bradyrhizobium sp. CCBAU 53380]MDA9420843.1 hypothetical protein [Bradyrhizobium sp. CCBAU 53380]
MVSVTPKLRTKRVRMKVSKKTSKQVATALAFMRKKLAEAYPGEISATPRTNKQLRDSGRGHLADLNESLGLRKS